MQIQTDHPLSQLDNFILRNNQQPTPRRSYLSSQQPKNGLPIARQLDHKENQPLIQNANRSPARSVSKKALTSHQNSQTSLNLSRQRAKSRKSCRAPKRHCQNHEENQGAYKINIQGQDLFYCEKCAHKLKSQGFPVKFSHVEPRGSGVRSQASQESTMLSSFPHLQGHPQFEVLKMLLGRIYQSQNSLKKANQTSFNIEDIFQRASQSFDEHMNKIEETIRCHRAEGQNLLMKLFNEYQAQHSNDIASVECLQEIQVMKNDIESNIESIVQDVDQQTFEQCVQSYKQRIEDLNKISAFSLQNRELIKTQLETVKFQTIQRLRYDLQMAQSCFKGQEEDENIYCNQGLSNGKNQGQSRSAFRNIFQPNWSRGRKRGVSKR